MYQKITIIGYLGSKPELRFTPNGNQVTTLNVATSFKYKDQTETTWFRVSVWGDLAENCVNYLDKGSLVLVEGRLKPNKDGNPPTYLRKDNTTGSSFEVRSENVRFLSGKSDITEGPNDYQNDEDIPF